MKRILVLLAVLLPLVAAKTYAQDYRRGQIIVRMRAAVPPAESDRLAADLGAVPVRRFETTGAELWAIGSLPVEEAIGRLASDARVDYAEPNYVVRADALYPDDPSFSQMWALDNTGQTGGAPDADIDAPEAWETETGGDVLVGVIDSGVDYTHPDLIANMWTNPGEVPGNGLDDDGNGYVDDIHGWDFINDDNDPMDDNGHGTHVAGTIAAAGNNGIGVTGVSWSARIMALKFLGAGGTGSVADAIEALDYATRMGARLTNNSWGGGGFSRAMSEAIEAAGAQGRLFVAAAGNTGADADAFPHYPAAYEAGNIISVANTDPFDGLNRSSTYGAVSVDLGAPGTDILSTVPGGNYALLTGTSMASPHVAGAAALLWSAAPALAHQTVRDLLLDSVDRVPALEGRTVTGGRLNIATALGRLDSIPPAPVTDLRVTATGSNTATLAWTATGDDRADGTAARYEIRYATEPLSPDNFEDATPAPGAPAPAPAGSPETFVVTGLDFTTRYFVAVRVHDEQENASALSNVVSATTLGIPHLLFSPGAFADTLHTGEVAAQVLTLGNTAEGTLDFTFVGLPGWLRTRPAAGQVPAGETMDVEVIFDAARLHTGRYDAAIVMATNDPLQPDAEVTAVLGVRAAPDAAADRTGLDYGMRYVGTVAVDTVRIRNTGTAILDVARVTADAPGFYVSPSGFRLGPAQERPLAVRFSPLRPGAVAGTLAVSSNDPDQPSLTVGLSGSGTDPPGQELSPSAVTLGLVTGATGTAAIRVRNTGGDTLRFHAGLPAVPAWARVAPESAAVAPGGEVTVELVLDAEGLAGGGYDADLRVTGNAPGAPLTVVPVRLDVTPAPDMTVSTDTLDFGTVFVGGSRVRTVTVGNDGVLPLTVSRIATEHEAFGTDVSTLSVPPGEARAVHVTFSPADAGVSTATMELSGDDPDAPRERVVLRGRSAAGPVMSVSPVSLDAEVATGATATRALTIRNTGRAPLEYLVSPRPVPLPEESVERAAAAGDFPRGTSPPSIGRAPVHDGAPAPADPAATSASGRAFAIAATAPNNIFATRFDPDAPGILPSLERVPAYVWAGDFALGESAHVYTVDTENRLATVDTLDGARRVLGTIVASGDEGWTGMAVDPTSGRVYATASDVGHSSLYEIDLERVTAMRIGDMGFAGVISVAVDDAGVMYAQDIVTDQLLRVDKYTGAGTAIGSLGFDANFGQGMAFDAGTGRLYIAAFNNVTFRGEMRIADRNTGATTLVGVLGDIVPGIMTQLGWMGVPHRDVPWLRVEPASGTVAPGGEAVVEVTVAAAGLDAGSYRGQLLVTGNDPGAAGVVVEAAATVSAAPDIAVAPVAVDFGDVYVGATAAATVTVTNGGSAALDVSSVSIEHPDVTASGVPFTLSPGQSRDIGLVFAPSSAGGLSAALSISSNDPRDSVAEVTLSGSASRPPSITPPAGTVSARLSTGDTAVRELAIDNTAGGTDLEWTAVVVTRGQRERLAYSLHPPPQQAVDPDGASVSPVAPAEPVTAVLSDLGGMRVMFDRSHGQTTQYPWSTFIADLESRGARVEVNTEPVTRSLLDGYDVFWTAEMRVPWTSAELGAISDWLVHGGGVILEGDDDGTVPIFNALLDAAGAGIAYDIADGTSGTTTNVYPHATTLDVRRVLLIGNTAHLSVVEEPARLLIEDVAGVPAAAASEVGTGRIVAVADEVLSNGRFGTRSQNQRFGNQAFDWVAAAGRWLTVTPPQGVVPAGERAEVALAFNGAGLDGGVYDAEITITSNDPVRPEVVVPARLDITAAPSMTRSAAAIDFGRTYVGVPVSDTLAVTNDGVEPLEVTSVAAMNPAFAVDASSFRLDPGARRVLNVVCTPAAPGSLATVLSIASNDPGDAVVTVVLSARAIAPPRVSVSPPALEVTGLHTGGSTSRTVIVSNAGGSDLELGIGPRRAVDEAAGDPGKPWRRMQRAGGGTGGPEIHPRSDSRDPGAGVAVAAAQSDSARVLVIQNRTAWGVDLASLLRSRFSAAATVIHADQLETTDLTRFDVIVTAGDQDADYYDTIHLAVDRFEAFVAAGGLIEYHLATQGSDVAMPGGAVMDYGGFERNNLNVMPAHPVMNGLPAVLVGSVANHGTLERLPEGARVLTVTGSSGRATTAEYDIGRGRVLATAMTWEFLYQAGFDAGRMLVNALAYSLDFGGAWLSVRPAAAVLPPGGSGTFTVTWNADGLAGGAYDARLLITSNDPFTPEASVPVHLDVTAAPDIRLPAAAGALDMGAAFVATAVSETLRVANRGSDVLRVSAVDAGSGAFTVDATAFDVAPGAEHLLAVGFAPTATGPAEGVLSIASNDPDEPSIEVLLAGHGRAAPSMAVSATVLRDSLATGGESLHTVVVGNDGAGVLEFEAAVRGPGGGEVPWLRLGTSGASAPPSVRHAVAVTLDAAALDDGEYAADVVVTGNDPFSPAAVVPVRLRVTGAPQIVAAGGPLDFGTVFAGASARDTVTVTNAGVRTLLVSRIAVDGRGYTSAPQSMEVAPGDSGHVVVTFVPPAAGALPGRMRLWSNDADDGAVDIEVFGTGIDPPAMRVSPKALADTLHAGTASRHRVRIDNAGTTMLEWSSAAQDEWLSVQPGAGTVSPGGYRLIDVVADASGLAAGRHDGALRVSGNDPAAESVVIPFTLFVTGTPGMSLAGDAERETPHVFALHENVPNPFNPVTTIRYDLPVAAGVRLDIFDVRGRRVATLAAGRRPAGRHRVSWDGRNATGERVASGVYFYRLRAGDFVRTRKMVLLK